MFSFPDARKVCNRLRWIGKTRKMAGTSGNSFSGSYRVHIDRWFQANRFQANIDMAMISNIETSRVSRISQIPVF